MTRRFSEKLEAYLDGIAVEHGQWLIRQDEYVEEEALAYESLFCLTNGYLATRGSYEEGTARSLPCTFVNGVFDKSETFMRELVNLPNWLGLRLYVEKEPVGLDSCERYDFVRALNLRDGCLVRSCRLRDRKGRETLLESVRFVSRAHDHRMGIRLFFTPLNYSGVVEAEQILDGTVLNFADAPRFKVKHTELVANAPLGESGGAYLEVRTRDDGLHVGCGAVLTVEQDGEDRRRSAAFRAFGEQAVEFVDFEARQGETVTLTKYAGLYTEREVAGERLQASVREELEGFCSDGFEREFAAHRQCYAQLWEQADIRILGDEDLDLAVRFNLFHLMSTAGRDDRVNLGAKLLHGEEYGGHAFWDTELFLLPFFAYVFPEKARNLELYRCHLLGAARANARRNGYAGAQYPWESADDGSEQCPDWTIEPDGSCTRCHVAEYEHHVTAAVAYGICNYVRITGDEEFLLTKGIEVLVETARFWASRCQYVPERDRYEIRQVTGPDEWHEPVDNNLYTNYLARWNLRYVSGLLRELREEKPQAYDTLCRRLQLTAEEEAGWDAVQGKLYLPRQEGTVLLEQFEGYFDLQEVTVRRYDRNDWPVRPPELRTVDKQKTQIIKQADVVMLLLLFGEEFDRQTQLENYRYYEKRTLHGSSLSPSVHAVMGLRVGDDARALRYLRRSAFLDLLDLQKNTREGIHAANAGGVWQTVVFGFAGVSVEEGTLCVRPRLPKEWDGLQFRLHYRGTWLEIAVSGEGQADVTVLEGEEIPVRVNGEPRLARRKQPDPDL